VELDQQKLVAFLSKAHNSLSVHLFETLPSTNETLWHLIEQGAEPGTVVIAMKQTSGRGQWGRQWSSPAGGLYLSVAIAPDLPAHQSYQLTFCSAWGIASQLRNYRIPVGIKWPNDLVLGEQKLGGILTETKVQQKRITKAVVGVGINWANPVPATGINLKSFLASEPTPPITCLEMLAALTILGIASGGELYSQAGIDALLPSYQNLLTSMGRLVSIDGRSGIVVGVTSNGELRVRFSPMEEISLKPGTISLGYG